MNVNRPNWLPTNLPELDGLRGLAIIGVLFYHCHPRLIGTWIYNASLWGWSGVTLFFVLSGFLITSILLSTNTRPHYFHNFYGRRALRIWPVYILVLTICYWQSHWFVGTAPSIAIRNAPWLVYLLFVQNLFHLVLPSAIGPTWSLAIEQQYYLLWAPFVRYLRRPTLLAGILALTLIASPVLRLTHYSWLTPTHTLTHLDGIAWGSLIALGLNTLSLHRRTWLYLGLGAIFIGFSLAASIAGGTAFLDSALALAFAGIVLATIATTGSRNPASAILQRGPLPFYGRISYGLYMIHIMVFIYYGWFDLRMDAYGIPGNLAVVVLRIAASTVLATILWYAFESQILKLKKYF